MQDHAGVGGLVTALTSSTAIKLLASAAGAVMSLAFIDRLSLRGRVLAVLQGFVIAVWVAPLVTSGVAHVAPFLGGGNLDAGIHFMVALSGMTVLPPFLEWLRGRASDPFRGWGGLLSSLLRRPPGPPAGGEGRA